ncbi:MAG: response regulator [Candidatus Omnitrophota bacterium]
MPKIMIVDDDEEVLVTLGNYFEVRGYETVKCLSGEEALNIMSKDRSIDLLVLDRRMPGMTGGDVLNELQKMNYNVPVILLTGSVGKESKKLEEKVDALFVKPSKLDDLLDKINELLK